VHELSIADSIVRIAVDHAAGRRVERVNVRVGHLRQVVPDALEFAFSLLAEGTPLDGAQLEIEAVPIAVACDRCEAISELDGFPLVCGSCRGLSVTVVRGEELSVDSLDVVDEALV
jgi:hydrogenase nickel incorporation protein HypA/HybF